MPSGFPQDRADRFADRLDIGIGCGVCIACLSFVCIAMDGGDAADVRRQLRIMTPDIWSDGLDAPALAAVRAARDRGDPDAQAALDELERRGGRSTVARAIVRVLAERLRRRVNTELEIGNRARPRLRRAPPEWN
jgi:hypothetical protein